MEVTTLVPTARPLVTPAVLDMWRPPGILRDKDEARREGVWNVRDNRSVAEYWAKQQSIAPVEAVREAIRRQGKYPEDLTRDDRGLLATLDEFHCLNDVATNELVRLAGLRQGAYVLDVGCGLGGPSRRLAAEYGCEILAIDITRPFLDVASGLTERATLSGKIEFIHGDAVDHSFPRQSFDFVWMQVAAANIFARGPLYRNVFRALRPGGRLALYDIFEGPNPGLHFPVPWSFDGSTSALLTEGDTIALCRAAGFKYITGRIDGRAQSWFEAEWRRTTAAPVSGAPALGFEILLPRWSEMCASQILNLREDRLRFGYLVFEKS